MSLILMLTPLKVPQELINVKNLYEKGIITSTPIM